MNLSKKLIPLSCALMAIGSAHATNGYFPLGYGMKSQGMGGASMALAQDSYGGANNPASMVWAGSRLDLGGTWFKPVRDAERSGALMPTLNGKVTSDREDFLVPEFGYNQMINSDLSLGLSVYGNGGMNTTYPQGNFNCGGGPANILCGSGTLGVNVIQLMVAPTVAYKLNPQHSVGATVLLAYQQFKAQGLQSFDNAPGFPPFTGAPGSVTNRGNDSAPGGGVRRDGIVRRQGVCPSQQRSELVAQALGSELHGPRGGEYPGVLSDHRDHAHQPRAEAAGVFRGQRGPEFLDAPEALRAPAGSVSGDGQDADAGGVGVLMQPDADAGENERGADVIGLGDAAG